MQETTAKNDCYEHLNLQGVKAKQYLPWGYFDHGFHNLMALIRQEWFSCPSKPKIWKSYIYETIHKYKPDSGHLKNR